MSPVQEVRIRAVAATLGTHDLYWTFAVKSELRFMRPKLISIAITLFWIGMMCSLVALHVLPERRRAQSLLIEPQILASQWLDINEWSWIRHEGQTVGGMVLSVTQEHSGKDNALRGYRVVQNGKVTIPVLLFQQQVDFNLTMSLSPEFNVSKFVVSIRVPPLQADLSGFVLENRFFYRVTPNHGVSIYGVIPLKHPLSLLSAVRPMIARQMDLIVGRVYPVDIVDPFNNMTRGQAQVKVAAQEAIVVNGKKIPAFRLDTTFGGITKKSWVSQDGTTLRRELLKGYVMDQSDKPSVLAQFPDLRRIIRVPDFNVEEFLQNIDKQGAKQSPLPADVLQVVGQMVGGE